jgi:peptidoglycan/xylan/chitin deacetylase (PgdA/CDA1 family)
VTGRHTVAPPSSSRPSHAPPDACSPAPPTYGALVISLDFELHWGVRDATPVDGPYRNNLLGARRVVPQLLDLFEEFGVAATWATVGFLFARSRRELERFSPACRPAYTEPTLDPYRETVGTDEAADELHFAPSLIDAIRRRPGQEIATHTFSHYYCLEPGQDRAAFQADLASAMGIARASGMRLRSIVFPRNQHNPAYDDLLLAAGLSCYRGNPRLWMYTAAATPRHHRHWLKRGARLLDSYVDAAGPHTARWDDIRQPNGLCNVPASFFLRPCAPRWPRFERLRLRRLVRSLEWAAATKEIVHVWWHPHNFGAHTAENLTFLRALLEAFARLRDTHGMHSLTMTDVAELAPSVSRHAPCTARVPEPAAFESNPLVKG